MENEATRSASLGSTGFGEETRRFLQDRLRVLSGTVTLIIAVLSFAFILNIAFSE